VLFVVSLAGALMPAFLAITNTQTTNERAIATNAERVVSARPRRTDGGGVIACRVHAIGEEDHEHLALGIDPHRCAREARVPVSGGSEEAPDQQLVGDRIDVREAGQVADDRADARAAAGQPDHVRAVSLIDEMYESYTLEFHRVTREPGGPLMFAPYDAAPGHGAHAAASTHTTRPHPAPLPAFLPAPAV